MRIGISVTSSYPGVDPRSGAAAMVARATAAERAGLDSLFVGDHHATPQPYFQNSAILGRLLAEWGPRPFGALYLLPLWHPVLLAEQVGTLAAIGDGRFILQCAIGPDDFQFPRMGVDKTQRPSRFEQSLDILRRLWRGEIVSSEGRYSFSEARVSPVPEEAVEIWIGATAEVAIARAARLGDGWLASPHLSPDKARAKLRVYERACEEAGTDLGTTAIRRDVYVGESAGEAEAHGGAVVSAGYRGFSPEAPIVGDASQVARSFAALETMGYTDVIVRNLSPDPDQAIRSTERLADVRRLLAGT